MEAAFTTVGEIVQPHVAHHPGLKVWAERLLFAFLFLLFVFRAFLPAWRHIDSDFTNYYLAARIYREGYPVERVYEWTWFQRQKDHLGLDRPLVGFAQSALPSVLFVAPLSFMAPLTANRWWLVVNLALLPLTGLVLKKMTSMPLRRVGALMFLAVSPLQSNFLLGQAHLIMLLLLAVAAWLYFDQRHFLSGFVLASAVVLKAYPILFLLFFIVKKQWRAAAGVLCGTLGAVLVSLRLFGTAACRIYILEILPWGLRGEIIDPYATEWDSLNALLRRLFVLEPELNPHPVAHLPNLYAFLYSFVCALILIAFLWAIADAGVDPSRKKLEWASFCLLLLLLSSEPFTYHFVVLILTAVLAVDYLTNRGKLAWATVFVVVYVLVCAPYNRLYGASPTGWVSLLYFPRLFWMLLLAGTLLWVLISDSGKTLRERVRSRALAHAGIAFVSLFAIGFVLEVRHLAGQFDNYRTRVTMTFGSATALDPIATDAGIFYGGLLPRFDAQGDAYSVYRLQVSSITPFGGGGDWFHPAATPDGGRTWAEVASTNSRVVRFEATEKASKGAAIVTEVDEGEQPTVSADGHWLAYIREVRGRGSLWIRRVDGLESEVKPGGEREIAGQQYDVREVAFSPEDQVVFSSWQTKQYRLFSIDLRTSLIAALTSVGCSARYPAFSPDGQWIAFSCERRGVWQLTAMNLRREEKHQLTTADCNSVTPAWTRDSRSLIYATDCGRGLGIMALSKIEVVR